jgi:uncharacterized protein (TIGR02246 family)
MAEEDLCMEIGAMSMARGGSGVAGARGRSTVTKKVLLALLFAAAFSPAVAVASACDAAPADTAAIRALWAALDAHWNARDAERFGALFDRDASFEFVDRDERMAGRAAVLAHFAERFPTFAPDVRHVTTVRHIAELVPGLQLLDGMVEIVRVTVSPDDGAAEGVGSEGSAVPLRTFSITAVMRERAGGEWGIAALRVWER